MSCQVLGCRYAHCHTTAGHQCGNCHGYGHGRVECDDEFAYRQLDRVSVAQRLMGMSRGKVYVRLSGAMGGYYVATRDHLHGRIMMYHQSPADDHRIIAMLISDYRHVGDGYCD